MLRHHPLMMRTSVARVQMIPHVMEVHLEHMKWASVWLDYERYDELDNDCDGKTDGGFNSLCEPCVDTSEETCDLFDHDRDGRTDERVRAV